MRQITQTRRDRRRFLTSALAAGLLAAPLVARAGNARLASADGAITVTAMADGFETPWSLAFLPGGHWLMTEREGRLWHIGPDGRRQQVAGVPQVVARGQGGLLDVMVPRDFASSRQVFLSHVRADGRDTGTAISTARLSPDGQRLEDARLFFSSAPAGRGGRHFGGRLVEGRDGMIYLSTGDRGDDDSAQDLANHNGAILRLTRAGAVPPDNPFRTTPGAQPEIWSYGHRNPQGLALDLQGRLWSHEHGARGGDEVNRIRRGANYGWPVIAYGRHYTGGKIGIGTHADGMEQPDFYWDPSIAPSGFVICSGRMFARWRGDLLVGSLKFGLISRLRGTPLREVERIEGAATARVRDLREAPDGAIWMISENNGAVYRLTPG